MGELFHVEHFYYDQSKTYETRPRFWLPLTQFRLLGGDQGDLARTDWEVSYRMTRLHAMHSEEESRELIAFRGFGTAQDTPSVRRIQPRCD